MQGTLLPGQVAMEYEFMVPVYHDVSSGVSFRPVSLHGMIILVLLVAIVLFKFKLRIPKKHARA
jgi:hypothetical protein